MSSEPKKVKMSEHLAKVADNFSNDYNEKDDPIESFSSPSPSPDAPTEKPKPNSSKNITAFVEKNVGENDVTLVVRVSLQELAKRYSDDVRIQQIFIEEMRSELKKKSSK
jgi:hypothetical protein